MDFEKEKTEFVKWECSDCTSRISGSLRYISAAIEEHKNINHPASEKKECEHPFGALWADKLKKDGILECTLCDTRLYVPSPSPKCHDCGASWHECCGHNIPQKYDLVEEKIKDIREHYTYNGVKMCDRLDSELRDLITLARTERKD